MKTVLQVQNMEKYYGNKGNVTKAVDGISFDVEKGELHRYYGSVRKRKNYAA